MAFKQGQFDTTGFNPYKYRTSGSIIPRTYKIGGFEIGEEPYKQLQLMATLGQAGLVGESDFANALMGAINQSQQFNPYGSMQQNPSMMMGGAGLPQALPDSLDVTDEDYQAFQDAQKQAGRSWINNVGDFATGPYTPIGQLKFAGKGLLSNARSVGNSSLMNDTLLPKLGGFEDVTRNYRDLFNTIGSNLLGQ